MRANPWHPRISPFFTYIALMALATAVRPWVPSLWPVLYAVQCGATVWLLWRYRALVPELNWSFHWLAVPTGVGLLVAWVGLGWLMAGEFSHRFNALLAGETTGLLPYRSDPALEPGPFTTTDTSWMLELPVGVFSIALGLKLLGMTLVVPMFEELFVRSTLLRGLHSARQTGLGLMQWLIDSPLGEWLLHTRWGEHASKQSGAFTRQLEQNPVGALSVFAVTLSTVIFMLSHAPRDWPGCIACGIVWCLLVWWTNRGDKKLGLGPVVWSHAITNALLWAYTLWSWDWQFL